MADNKKYYYIRLKEYFFEDDAIILLESMPDGYLYSNILLKMVLKSLKGDGKLMYNNIMPYSPQALSVLTRHPVGVVEKALEQFELLGLIERLDNGAIYMLNIQNLIGKSTTEADRKRDYERKIAEEKASVQSIGEISEKSPRNVQEILEKSTPEIEIELETEIEKDIDTKIEIKTDTEPKPKRKKEKPPSVYFDSEKLNAAFYDFIGMRKNIKAPMTERAKELAVMRIKKLASIPFSDSFDEDLAIEILNQSIMNSWKGLFPLKNDDSKKDKIANRVSEVDTWV